MERAGNYDLAIQRGDWGYFASVTLSVGLEAADEGLVVEFETAGDAWRAGAQFGVAYAYEKSVDQIGQRQRVRVRVTEIRGHIIDTTEICVAYAAAHAFWKALDLTPLQQPSGDFDAGLFVFPK